MRALIFWKYFQRSAAASLLSPLLLMVLFTQSNYSYAQVDETLTELWKKEGELKQRLAEYEKKHDNSKSYYRDFYFGFGISLASENFEKDGDYPGTNSTVPYGFEPVYVGNAAHALLDFPGHTIGRIIKVNTNFGYLWSDALSFELSFDYISGFKWDNLEPKSGTAYSVGSILHTYISTVTASVKYFPYVTLSGATRIRPYVHAGGGRLQAEVEVKHFSDANSALNLTLFDVDVPISISLITSEGSDTLYDFCIKAGFGVNIFVNNGMSLAVEYSYFDGLGDVSDINFNKLTAGLVYYL
ncbi:MAG: porin family protein [Pseudomonadales bacterium]|nr:porin family protein [Pseudomonadales bacterium]